MNLCGMNTYDVNYVAVITEIEQNPINITLGQSSSSQDYKTISYFGISGMSICGFTTPSLHKSSY